VFAQDATSTAAEPKTAEASPDTPAAIKDYTARHTFEVHQAVFLQKMLAQDLGLASEQLAKINRQFAEFIRATMENKPRPILIAYSGETKFNYDGKILAPDGDTAEELHEQLKASGEFDRPRFMDLLREHLDMTQVHRFQIIVDRWNALRPVPLDGPFRRVSRALKDPNLALPPEELAAASEEVAALFQSIPKTERRPGPIDKYAPELKERVVAKLQPKHAERFQKTLDWMEADYAEWRQPRHVEAVYADAVRLLTEPSAAKTEAPK
jgi:hypothetical protein